MKENGRERQQYRPMKISPQELYRSLGAFQIIS